MILITQSTLTNLLIYIINNIFSNLFSSINSNITNFLDKLVFVSPDITSDLMQIIGTNSHSGVILICNSLVYGFLLYYAFSYLLSHLTFSQVERPTQFIFKLLLCVIALNASYFLCSFLIFICSYTSSMIQDIGNYYFNYEISFSSFLSNIIPAEYFSSNSFNLFSFDRNSQKLNIFWIFKFKHFICN